MKILRSEQGRHFTIQTKELSTSDMPSLNRVSLRILSLLRENTLYPKQIAKSLRLHEQNIYYYIRKLEASGLIHIHHTEKIHGTVANFYTLSSEAFHFRIGDFHDSPRIQEKQSTYLSPFIDRGKLNALIVVGSPDPHGPQKARSRDGYFGMDLALFLGTFLSYIPHSMVRLDTEVRDSDLQQNNLIIIGGPIVNKVTAMVNRKMPVYFDEETKGIHSSITRKTYFADETGIINKFKNPFNHEKQILLVAGLRNAGTKAAILAFLKSFDNLKQGNIFRPLTHSRIVEGIDLDSDGIVDAVEFLE